MGGRCGNPYCHSPDPEMRPPTAQELRFWSSEADKKDLDLLDRGQVCLMICKACGTWTAEGWDQKENKTKHGWVPSPFRFEVGDRLRVTLEGKRFGMLGTVTRRGRLTKMLMPPPVPENFYWLVFEEGQIEEGYDENDLDPKK